MTYPSNSADGQVRAFIDRILRMKEEEKAIKDDIKEIYAEAKANGFDKTQLGRAVTIVQKRQKDGDAVDEADAILDLYLAAYYGTGTRVATHTHAHEDHDPETGEVLDTSSTAAGKDRHGSGTANDPRVNDGDGEPKNSLYPKLAAGTQAPPVDTHAREDEGLAGPANAPDAGTANTKPAHNSEPVEGAPADEAEPPKVEASSATLEPVTDYIVFYDADADGRCLDPDLCGSNSRLAICDKCKAAAGHPVEAAA